MKRVKLTREQAEKIVDDMENDKVKYKDGIKNQHEALYEGMTRKDKHYDKETIEKLYRETGDVGLMDKELAGKILDLFFVGKYQSSTIVATCKAVTLTVIAEAMEHELEAEVEDLKKKEKWN